MATTFTTGKVRLSYPALFAPKAAPGSDRLKYSASIIVPKSDKATLKKIQDAVEEAKNLGKTTKWGGKIPAKLKTPLRDGDEERPDDPAYADSYFFNCSSDRKPGIVDRNLQAILDPEEIYAGCYVRVNVNAYPFDSNGNRGIAMGLNHVQFWMDGDHLGAGAVSAEDAFDDDYEDDLDDLLG